jgi:hypothetical protein
MCGPARRLADRPPVGGRRFGRAGRSGCASYWVRAGSAAWVMCAAITPLKSSSVMTSAESKCVEPHAMTKRDTYHRSRPTPRHAASPARRSSSLSTLTAAARLALRARVVTARGRKFGVRIPRRLAMGCKRRGGGRPSRVPVICVRTCSVCEYRAQTVRGNVAAGDQRHGAPARLDPASQQCGCRDRAGSLGDGPGFDHELTHGGF